jgi:cysteine desulfurase
MKLDLEGLAVSAGSACTAGVVRISHVLNAMELTREEALGSLRFSFGFQTTRDEVESAVNILESCILQVRTRG